jgi:hypothetical protein
LTHHGFTTTIQKILADEFGKSAKAIFENSLLMQYLNIKTRAASRGSKSRGSFGNLYALYVLIEDYVGRDFHRRGDYAKYEGASFSKMFKRQRRLPFGAKLQNHHLNHRLNEEFEKFFPKAGLRPILRNHDTQRYWINSKLLKIDLASGRKIDIAQTVVKIINAYMEARRDAFEKIIKDCRKWGALDKSNGGKVAEFILSLIQPNVDARIFEIVSYAILKQSYGNTAVYFGWTRETIRKESIILYKTGRTNANDGGIDFVMRPVGRFFQVTETVDVSKYFLDIDKVQKFPVTFVVKSAESAEQIKSMIQNQAVALYPVAAIVEKYMACIEEVINIPSLVQRFQKIVEQGGVAVAAVLSEISLQSRVEYNYLEGASTEASEGED